MTPLTTGDRRCALAAGIVALLVACGGGGSATPLASAAGSTSQDGVLWCTRYDRFAASAMLVAVDAAAPDAPERLAEIRDGEGGASDDLFAATEDAEVLLLGTPVPEPLSEALPALLGIGGGALDPEAVGAVEDHVRAACGSDPAAVALLARLGGG